MIIETVDLTKMYGNKVGCEKICLSVGEGQIFGFLGPNGAGKSTFVKMLVGLIRPTSGQAMILQQPLGSLEARRRIGFLPEEFSYQNYLTGQELLDYHGQLCKMPKPLRRERIAKVLNLVKLEESGVRSIKAYSKGMGQRLGIACAMLADPDLLFLDEPTSALDPIGRREVREILLDLKAQGKTVFLNSHLLSEVEMVCDEVAIIKQGRIIVRDKLANLLAQGVQVEVEVPDLTDTVKNMLAKVGDIVSIEGSRITLTMNEPDGVPKLAEIIVGSGLHLYGLNVRHRSLEDLFFEIIQGGDG